MTRILLCLISPLMFSGCNDVEPSFGDYDPITPNGIRSRIETSEYRMECTLRNREQSEGYITAVLKISPYGGSSREILTNNIRSEDEYYSRLGFFTSKIDKYLVLVVDNSDSIPCSQTIYEDSRGVAPYSTTMAYFDLHDRHPKCLDLIYKDKVLGMGHVKFSFDNKLVSNLH